jgi:hypothetical protein
LIRHLHHLSRKTIGSWPHPNPLLAERERKKLTR